MDALREVVAVLGGAAGLILAAGALVRMLFKSALDKDLKAFEIRLKGDADTALAGVTADYRKKADRELAILTDHLTRQREADAKLAEASREKAEKLRLAVSHWANPIRGSVLDLKKRLENILDDGAYLALQERPAQPIPPDWSIDRDYFLPSTLYLFCQYFHWVRRLQLDINFELFDTHAEKDAFMERVRDVGQALSEWPAPVACSGLDRQVFTLQQRALGEALMVRSDGGRCMGYDEFLLQADDSPLCDLLPPLRALLDGLEPGDCRWRRLQRALEALNKLDRHTRDLLQRPEARTSLASAAKEAAPLAIPVQ